VSEHQDKDKNKKKHAPAPHGHGAGAAHDEEEHHEGAPEWIISFADNTALMMGFFVILLAMNMAPKGSNASPTGDPNADPGQPTAAQLDWALGVREGFNNPVRLDSTDPRDALLLKRLKERMELEKKEQAPKGTYDKVQSLRKSDYYSVSAAVGFPGHSAELGGEARKTIQDTAAHLRGVRLMVEVHGHCSAAEAYVSLDKGMALSFNRAMAVARELTKLGIDWRQIRLIAHGDADRSRAAAHTAGQQPVNQRVEIVRTDQLMAESDPPGDRR
jgi:flagellar motor protein MotB